MGEQQNSARTACAAMISHKKSETLVKGDARKYHDTDTDDQLNNIERRKIPEVQLELKTWNSAVHTAPAQNTTCRQCQALRRRVLADEDTEEGDDRDSHPLE